MGEAGKPARLPPPKVVLFDIGGVCVISPFKAIAEYERAHGIPSGYINHTISATSPNGSWQRLERGEMSLDDAFFAAFGAELTSAEHWARYCRARQQHSAASDAVPPVPRIDAKAVFWNMMRSARGHDPHMFPALRRLRASGRFLVAALSNTVAFPDGVRDDRGELFRSGLSSLPAATASPSPSRRKEGRAGTQPTRFFDGGRELELDADDDSAEDVRRAFDLFVSSAHIGMRKPEARAYEFAVREVQRLARERDPDAAAVEPADILFLDDIGANLKAARALGLRTIKVNLGRVPEAVAELERAVGMDLTGGAGRAKM